MVNRNGSKWQLSVERQMWMAVVYCRTERVLPICAESWADLLVRIPLMRHNLSEANNWRTVFRPGNGDWLGHMQMVSSGHARLTTPATYADLQQRCSLLRGLLPRRVRLIWILFLHASFSRKTSKLTSGQLAVLTMKYCWTLVNSPCNAPQWLCPFLQLRLFLCLYKHEKFGKQTSTEKQSNGGSAAEIKVQVSAEVASVAESWQAKRKGWTFCWKRTTRAWRKQTRVNGGKKKQIAMYSVISAD